MGVPPGVGSGYGHFEVFGGGGELDGYRTIECSMLRGAPMNMQIKRLLDNINS